MKKFTNIAVAILLAVIVCIGSMPTDKVDAKSKDIYFPGDYRLQDKISPNEYYVVNLNKYSSPEGKKIGNFKLYYYFKPTDNWTLENKGELKKIGKNKYISTNGKFIFKIYKKKLVITQSKQKKWLKGTYKLKKRFSRP